ncbi:MAG: xanthine dehydrogenase family protein molybdopterin-binding subunit, partial [SAR324 cluster bacterium]|nr:xanthine dehydrogenase family protein molybdopterin-binding subunit [SAR324 cluster bacterium]
EIPSGVAVVADSYWKARSATSAIKVEWAGGQTKLDSEGISAELKKLLDEPGKTVREDGDADAALAGVTWVEADYEAPHLAHATMEPMNCTAHVQGDRCEIWAPTQVPGPAREQVARALNLDQGNVVVHTTFLGGGFGRRLESDFVLEAAHVSRKVGRPVKVIWSREDDMVHGVYRPHVRHRFRGALNDAGKPVAWRHRIAAPSVLGAILPKWLPSMTPNATPAVINRGVAALVDGLFNNHWVADETSSEGASDTAYAIENLKVELALHDPGVPVGFWRSVGHSHTGFAVESFIDELAIAAGSDPYQFRRALLQNAPRHLGVLEAAAKAAGWGKPLPKGVFRGIAQHKSFNTYVAQVAEVSVSEGRVRVHRVLCAVDCGQVINPDIVRAQMESGIVFGLSAALKQRISYKEGQVEQSNFHNYTMLRMNEMPTIEVVIIASSEPPTGVGEPGVPPIAPALTNAIAAATGQRIRKLPIELVLRETAGTGKGMPRA